MSPSTDLTAREAEIIRILEVLSEEAPGFVIVGGYAVNALDGHRFSVDLDLVTDDKHLPHLDRVLRREKYERSKPDKSQTPRLHVREYVRLLGKEPAKVALYLNNFVCRQTRGEWACELIRKNSSREIVVGATSSTQSQVVRREFLVAMKIHSGRDQDLRDIVMLSERADWKTVAGFAACGSLERVKEQIESAIATVGGDRFESALKAEFALQADVKPLVRRTIRGLEKVGILLAEQDPQFRLKPVRFRKKIRASEIDRFLYRAK